MHSLKYGQTYFKNLALFTPQNFKSMFVHFSTLCMERLKEEDSALDFRPLVPNQKLYY